MADTSSGVEPKILVLVVSEIAGSSASVRGGGGMGPDYVGSVWKRCGSPGAAA